MLGEIQQNEKNNHIRVGSRSCYSCSPLPRLHPPTQILSTTSSPHAGPTLQVSTADPVFSRPNPWAPQDLFAYFRIRDKKSSSARAVRCWFSLPHPCCIKVTKLSRGSTEGNIFPFCGDSIVQVCCKNTVPSSCEAETAPKSLHSFVARKTELNTQPETSMLLLPQLAVLLFPFLCCFLLLFPEDIPRLSYYV